MMAERKCARPGCDDTEWRIDGYCSIYCRDVVEALEEGREAGALAMQAQIDTAMTERRDSYAAMGGVIAAGVMREALAIVRALDPAAVAKEAE